MERHHILCSICLFFVTLSCSKGGLEQVDDVCTKMDDIKFMEYCYNSFDVNKDGKVSMTEAAAVKSIDVKSIKTISSLKGLEFFTGLTELYCQGNQLTSLDVSNNTEIKVLDCLNNQIGRLDVSRNTSLVSLICGMNPLIKLDLSKNGALQELRCDSNKLEFLDVSSNTALVSLNCSNNQLTSLSLTANREIKTLSCYNNQISSLDLSITLWESRHYSDLERLGQKCELTLYLSSQQIQKVCSAIYGISGDWDATDCNNAISEVKSRYSISIQEKYHSPVPRGGGEVEDLNSVDLIPTYTSGLTQMVYLSL